MDTRLLPYLCVGVLLNAGCAKNAHPEDNKASPDTARSEPLAPTPDSAPSGQFLPSLEDAGVRFSTAAVRVPVDPTCINDTSGAGLAKELINLMERVVVVHGGSSPISDAGWPGLEVSQPWMKNQDLHSRFAEHCIYRAPKVEAACVGDACRSEARVADYTWNEIAVMIAQDCLPGGSAGCSGMGAEPGSFAITVLRKCQVFSLAGELFVASDGAGNRYVIHATESQTPRLDASLPSGWTLEQIRSDEPLEITPVGGEGECYHVIGFDNLNQLYTQFEFADAEFPPRPKADSWIRHSGREITATVLGHAVTWPGAGTQTWDAKGQTQAGESTGNWKVDGDMYCSQFPGQDWRCFALATSPDGTKIRVTGSGQATWVGQLSL